MSKILKYTLGLDMGTNFIGWAVVEHDDNLRPPGLISQGTRIFQEAVDAKQTQPMLVCEIWYRLGFAPVKPNLIFRYDNTGHNDFS